MSPQPGSTLTRLEEEQSLTVGAEQADAGEVEGPTLAAASGGALGPPARVPDVEGPWMYRERAALVEPPILP
jgi:hypothetical protein